MSRSLLTCLAAALLVPALSPARARAWGEDGHYLVALIAQAHLNGKARDGVADLIGPRSISDPQIPIWADRIKKSAFYKRRYPNNQKWHFIDLDVGQDLGSIDLDKACAHDDCVLKQLPRFVDVLRDPKAERACRREALFFVVHFVGDIHQPLHCAERNGDHGGNLVRVKLAHDEGGHAPVSNLHRVWDVDLVEEAMAGLSREDFAQRLDGEITPAQRKQWCKIDVKAWVLESHKLARDKAYAGVEGGQDHHVITLPQKYVEDNSEVVKVQLQRAGIRLAAVLNDAFD